MTNLQNIVFPKASICDKNNMYYRTSNMKFITRFDTNNRYINFQANISELYVSIDFLNFLNTSLLMPYFSNKTCRYEDRYYKKFYECQCGVFNSFPSISFMINGTLFEFQMKKMKDRPDLKDNENCTSSTKYVSIISSP